MPPRALKLHVLLVVYGRPAHSPYIVGRAFFVKYIPALDQPRSIGKAIGINQTRPQPTLGSKNPPTTYCPFPWVSSPERSFFLPVSFIFYLPSLLLHLVFLMVPKRSAGSIWEGGWFSRYDMSYDPNLLDASNRLSYIALGHSFLVRQYRQS